MAGSNAPEAFLVNYVMLPMHSETLFYDLIMTAKLTV